MSQTARLNPSHRAARAIKKIQKLAETDEDLYADDYARFSKHLALASQEGFASEVSFDGERNMKATNPAGLQDSKALLDLLVKVRLGDKGHNPRL